MSRSAQTSPTPSPGAATRRHTVRRFAAGTVEIVGDVWAGLRLDWAKGVGVPLDFAMPLHGVNLTFASQDRSRVRVEDGPTIEGPLPRGAVMLSVGERRTWVENPAAFEGLNIDLSHEKLEAYAIRNGHAPPRLRPAVLEVDERLHDIGRLIAAELQSHANDAGGLYRDALMNLLMAHLTERYGEKRDTLAGNALDGARLERVREHIEAHLGDALSLSTLSEVAAMSTFHFARSFKSATGMPPHRYVTRRRMERAKAMLLGTRLPVSDVGWRVGYAHTGNFIQAFRRALGVTPGELRQQAD